MRCGIISLEDIARDAASSKPCPGRAIDISPGPPPGVGDTYLSAAEQKIFDFDGT